MTTPPYEVLPVQHVLVVERAVSGEAFLETYRAHLDDIGVDATTLRTDGNGTIRSRLRGAEPEDLPELAGFDVGAILGSGGMGQVSSAWQHALEREVAIKGLKAGSIGETEALALVHEARITGQLEHPNVVPIHDLGRSADGDPMFAMKRIEGQAWSDWLTEPDAEQVERMQAAGGPLAFHVEVLIGVCNAVGYAHSRGILHRDLKPQNVMIGHFGEIYVVDWGIAGRIEDLSSGDPELVGTPAYMAPEMAAGEALTQAADIFQLGAILYELVAGCPPRPKATPMKALAVAWSGETLPIPETCPDALTRILRKALATDPSERHSDVSELQTELRTWLTNRPLLAMADAARQQVRAAIDDMRDGTGDPRARVRAARDAAATLEPLRARLDEPSLDELRIELLSELLRFEIDRERAGVADAILHELGDDATEAQRFQVEDALRAEAERAAELDRLRDQRNWTYGARIRQRYVLFLGVLQALIYVPVGIVEIAVVGHPIEFPRTWLPGIGIPSLGALAIVLMQPSGPAYETLGSRTQRALALTVVGANLVFLISLAIGQDLKTAFFYTLSLALGLPLAIQALFTTPRYFPPAALFGLAGLAVLVAPREYTFFVLPLGVAFAHTAAWWTDNVDAPADGSPVEP